MKKQFVLILFLLGFASAVQSHPVAYKGSKGLMGYNSPIISHTQMNYSFEYWFATGLHHILRPEESGKHASFATTNFLLKRWNGSGLQANIYANIGVGRSQLNDQAQNAGIGLLQFDIEDRDYYFLAKHVAIIGQDERELNQTIVRAGISPYVVNYDGIHSWLILEWQNANFRTGQDITDVTPFLRVFYQNLLFEIGQSFDGITKFNYITHF